MESQNEENILLSISDNGSNIPESDIPLYLTKDLLEILEVI